MAETRYTKDHEWVRLDGTSAVIGITDHAQASLGDLVFVELPEPGRTLTEGEACAVAESVKAASDIFAPLAGTVGEANKAVADDPTLINRDAEGRGWLFRLENIKVNKATLMDEAAYKAYLETLK